MPHSTCPVFRHCILDANRPGPHGRSSPHCSHVASLKTSLQVQIVGGKQVLTELEIPHIYHSAARGSPKRPAFEAKWGVGQYPYLEDPNTGIAMFETPQVCPIHLLTPDARPPAELPANSLAGTPQKLCWRLCVRLKLDWCRDLFAFAQPAGTLEGDHQCLTGPCCLCRLTSTSTRRMASDCSQHHSS